MYHVAGCPNQVWGLQAHCLLSKGLVTTSCSTSHNSCFFPKTFESHLAGRPHQKKMAQVERAKKLEAKVFIKSSWARLRVRVFSQIFTHRLKRTLRWPKMQCQDVKVLTIPWNQLMMEIFGVRYVVFLKLRLVSRLSRLVIHISNGLTQVCDCIMNSGAQAQAHLNGTKHRHRMDKVRM